MLNTITIMGRMTRDPEMRKTQNDKSVTSFTLAVDRDFSNGGEKQTDFIDCVAWNNTATFVSKYFSKGSMAVVSGSLQLRDWTDKEGNKRRNAEVIAQNVYFGDSKKPSVNEDSSVSEKPAKKASKSKKQEPEEDPEIDGDLPF